MRGSCCGIRQYFIKCTRSTVLIFLCLRFIFSSIAVAKEDIISIGVENLDYYPIVSSNVNEDTKGFVAELVKLVSEEYDLKVIIKSFPVSRLKLEMVHGNVDIQFPDNPIWTYEKGSHKTFSMPVVPYVDKYFSKIQHKDVESVATILGFTVVAKPAYPIQIHTPNSINSLFSMLDKDRVDAIYLNQNVATNYMKSNNVSVIPRNDLPSDNSFFYFSASTSKGNTFLNKLNLYVKQHYERYRHLLKKYGLENLVETSIGQGSFKVGYGIIPSAPNFSSLDDENNPFAFLKEKTDRFVSGPYITIENQFCSGEIDILYPAFDNHLPCDSNFQKLDDIEISIIKRKSITSVKKVGVILGFDYSAYPIPDNAIYQEVDNDLQLVNLFRQGIVDAIVIATDNFDKAAKDISANSYEKIYSKDLAIGFLKGKHVRL